MYLLLNLEASKMGQNSYDFPGEATHTATG